MDLHTVFEKVKKAVLTDEEKENQTVWERKVDVIMRYVSFSFLLIFFGLFSFFTGCIHGEESMKTMQYNIIRKENAELKEQIEVMRTQVNQLAPLLGTKEGLWKTRKLMKNK